MSSYKKFVAGAATATLVASAIAPVAAAADSKNFTDVNDRYKDAVDYVVSKGVNGLSETQFGVQQNIKRVDAAVFIAKALELDGANSPDSGFTDVPARAAKSVNALKEAKLINGKTANKFGSEDNLTRGEVSLILQKAYDLKGNANNVKFTDVSNRYLGAVAGMLDAKVTSGISETKFGTENPVKRGDLAIWLYKLKDHETNVDGGDDGAVAKGIKSVEAINDTTVKVEFTNAVDSDFIREAEKNGKYFRVFLEGDTAFSNDAIKSATLNFSNDGKTAEFTLGKTLDGKEDNILESGKKYTVALMDGDNKAADIKHSYGPVELKESAARPDFEVSALSDKIIVKFGEKMKSTALDVENYEVFDEGGKSLGMLIDFLDKDALTEDKEQGKWADATKKTTVEFPLYAKEDKVDNSHKHLLAGKKYKLHVNKDVKTDKNKNLSEKDRTITVKTPSVKDAQPKANTARVNNETELVVVFDQDVIAENANASQIDIKTSTGKTVAVEEVKQGEAKNELVIITKGGDDDKLEGDVTYRVSVPANAVSNAVFPNASNDAISDLRAKAQDDIEIKSVKAELKADPKDKKQANLYLTFDQRPNLEYFKKEAKDNKLIIEDGSDVYEATSAAANNMKYVDDKTIVIENVKESFAFEGEGGVGFQPEKGETYKLEIKADTVKTDAFGDKDAKVNQSKLKATFGGVSVTEPIVDKVTLVSANEIKVEFKEDISSISENDIYVSGVELLKNGRFDLTPLNGSSQLKASVSGSTLTLTTKDDTAFRTGFDKEFKIEVKANSFTSKDGKIENDKIVLEVSDDNTVIYNDEELSKAVDDAAPVLIGAEIAEYDNEIELTYSEALDFHGEQDRIATLFSVKKAANNAVGEEIKEGSADNKIIVVFNDQVFDEDTIMNEVEVTYSQGNAFYIMDAERNKAKKSTITGVQGSKSDLKESDKNKGEDEEKVDTKALESAIADAKKLKEEDYTPATWTDFSKALAGAEEALKNKKDQSTVDAALKDLKEAQDKLVEKDEGEETVTGKDLGIKATSALVGTTSLSIDIDKLTEEQKKQEISVTYEGETLIFEVNEYNTSTLIVDFQKEITQEEAEALVINFK